MKSALKYALALTLTLGSLQAADTNKKCNDLIMILDPETKEKTDGEKTALCADLMVALQEKAAPIIITTNIVENFCFWKNEYAEVLDEQRNLKISEGRFNDSFVGYGVHLYRIPMEQHE